jgi:cytochrome c-type biogenesis protein
MEQVGILAAIGAGFISFISPCVLPLVPAYISFISGASVAELQEGKHRSRIFNQVTAKALAFVLGFSLVFIILGASATAVGQLMLENLGIIIRIAGLVIIVFGLHMIGILKIGLLYREKRFQTQSKPTGLLGSFVVGLAFAFGWTPCIGPILAAVLAYAAVQETVGQGIYLLSAYSLGLALPFLITAVAINLFFRLFERIKPHMHKVEIIAGALLIAIGLLLVLDRFTVISGYLVDWFPWLVVG